MDQIQLQSENLTFYLQNCINLITIKLMFKQWFSLSTENSIMIHYQINIIKI